MTLRESSESRLVLAGRTVPVDLVVVSVAVLASLLVYYVVPSTPLRFLVSVPLLLFVPGYVLVGILFPRHGEVDRSNSSGNGSLATVRNLGRVTVPERAALSVGLSVALVPFYGFGLELLPVAAFGGAIIPMLVGGVLIGALVAAARRLRLPSDERFSLPLEAINTAITAPFTGPMPRAERLATIALAATVLLAVVSVGYVFAVPQDGEGFTDLRVMTESPGGELTLGDYPDQIGVDETAEFVIGIDNREDETQEYTVVVVAERVVQNDGSVTPIESTELGRFETSLDGGERALQAQTVTPESPGEFRLSYYLYTDEPPASPGADTAYRNVHLSVTAVNEAGADGTDDGGAFAVDGEIVDEPTDIQRIDNDPTVVGSAAR